MKVYLRLAVLALALHQAVGQLDYLDYDETDIVGKVQNIVDHKLEEEDDKVPRSLIGVFPFSEDHKSHDHDHDEHHHHDEHNDDEHHHDEHHHDEHHHDDEHHGDQEHQALGTSGDDITKAAGLLNEINNNGVADNSGKVCLDKVMFVNETVWEDQETCIHSYDKRCHDTFTTTYDSVQVEECDENFRKVCYINYEPRSFDEVVEVCHTPLVKNINKPGPTVCRTEYETHCATRRKVHEVEDDVVECREVIEKKCKFVTVGYVQKEQCDEWPVQKCDKTTALRKKYTPETSCLPQPHEVCGPEGFTMEPGQVQCYNETKTIVVDTPVEECELEPRQNCRHATKQVPKLVSVQECVDVPKEVCTWGRGNPRRVARPVIKKWCYTPTQESGLLQADF